MLPASLTAKLALMGWLDLPRVPEPEMMDDSAEVEAYSFAAAQAHLERIDDTFIEHALRLVGSRPTGLALDIGTGPGQIALKLARRLPGWQFIGVDRSPNMIRQARASIAAGGGEGQGFNPDANRAPDARDLDKHRAAAGFSPPQPQSPGTPRLSRAKPGDAAASSGREVSEPSRSGDARISIAAVKGRVQFFVADGNGLPFPDASFDLVMCNSVLHHLAQPQRLFAEIARLVKSDGAILIRDLRRPSWFAYPLHVRWHGRHYSGLMYELYCASVRAAYTVPELEALLRVSPLASARSASSGACAEQSRRARVFTRRRTHLGLERSLG